MLTASKKTRRTKIAMTALIALLNVISYASIASPSDLVASNAQVASAVKNSVLIKTTSPAIRSTLSQLVNPSNFDLTGPSTFGACDPYNSEELAISPKPCFFGNLRATKTIVLVGDSNVGNWVPALNLGLQGSPYRLAVFGFSSCGLADLPYTSSWSNLYQRCRLWHENLPLAIRALSPVAILASSGDVGTSYSNSTWAYGVKKVFNEATIGSTATKRILIGTSPFFGESVVTCLTIHPDPQECSLKYSTGTGYYGSALSRDKIVSKVSGAKLVNVSKFFCFEGTCSPVIGNILVYSDMDHVTVAYSTFISNAVTSAVLTALK